MTAGHEVQSLKTSYWELGRPIIMCSHYQDFQTSFTQKLHIESKLPYDNFTTVDIKNGYTQLKHYKLSLKLLQTYLVHIVHCPDRIW